MKNIDTAFRHIRTFSLILILANVLMFGFYVHRSDQRVERAENKVLILLNGKIVSAIVSDRKENMAVEARDHIRTFHELFFTLAPDEKVILENINKALYLADITAKQEYDNLEEKGYYSQIIAGNISQTISFDSVAVNTEVYPFTFKCYATQHIVRTTSKVSRSLVTTGYLRNVSRSDNNPHGFLIERWTTIENKDIQTEGR